MTPGSSSPRPVVRGLPRPGSITAIDLAALLYRLRRLVVLAMSMVLLSTLLVLVSLLVLILFWLG